MSKQIEDLPPSTGLPDLEKRREELLFLIKSKRISLGKLPSGKLRISNTNSGPQYYRVSGGADTTSNGRYIQKEEMLLIKGLAQRRYNEKVLTMAEAELKQIDAFIKQYHPERLHNLHSSLLPARQALITPVTLPDKEYAALWMSRLYPQRNSYPLKTEFMTKNGVLVRSKSELLIANVLDENNVPFLYEWPLYLRNRGKKSTTCVYPDFACLNLRTRKVVYWEHQGKMDDDKYASSAVEKQCLYLMNGLIPGCDIVFTMETADVPLDVQVVRCLIERLLL